MKTNSRNSTLNSSFDALLKLHDPYLRDQLFLLWYKEPGANAGLPNLSFVEGTHLMQFEHQLNEQSFSSVQHRVSWPEFWPLNDIQLLFG